MLYVNVPLGAGSVSGRGGGGRASETRRPDLEGERGESSGGDTRAGGGRPEETERKCHTGRPVLTVMCSGTSRRLPDAMKNWNFPTCKKNLLTCNPPDPKTWTWETKTHRCLTSFPALIRPAEFLDLGSGSQLVLLLFPRNSVLDLEMIRCPGSAAPDLQT